MHVVQRDDEGHDAATVQLAQLVRDERLRPLGEPLDDVDDLHGDRQPAISSFATTLRPGHVTHNVAPSRATPIGWLSGGNGATRSVPSRETNASASSSGNETHTPSAPTARSNGTAGSSI